MISHKFSQKTQSFHEKIWLNTYLLLSLHCHSRTERTVLMGRNPMMGDDGGCGKSHTKKPPCRGKPPLVNLTVLDMATQTRSRNEKNVRRCKENHLT